MQVLIPGNVFLGPLRILNHSRSLLSRIHEELVTRTGIIAGLIFPRSRETVSVPSPQPSTTTSTTAAERSVWDGILLWAVPKKRTSHSKKRMRMAHKYLKPKRHYLPCPKCGGLKLMHTLCGHCFRETMKLTAETRKQRLSTAKKDTELEEKSVH